LDGGQSSDEGRPVLRYNLGIVEGRFGFKQKMSEAVHAAQTLRGSHATTGIEGLDDILRGGLTPNRLYLVEGNPGSGKTTLALQFLLGGAQSGETGLYVTLSETKDELLAVGRSHGWDLSPIHIFEMVASEEGLSPENQLTMFHPSELELSETTRAVLEVVQRI